MSGRAFILRMNPAGVPRAAVGLQTNEVSTRRARSGQTLVSSFAARYGLA